MRNQFLASALMAAFVPFFAYPAHAAPEPGARETKVSYGDLALGTPSGAQTPDLRIRHAARAVCAEPGRPLRRFVAQRTCEEEAMSRAYRDISAQRGLNALADMSYAPADRPNR